MRAPNGMGIAGGRSSAIPLSAYQDGVARVPGVTPPSTPPNAYTTSGLTASQACNWFSSVQFQTAPNLPYVDVVAVPWTASTFPTTVGYWLDGVFTSTLSFPGTVGTKQVVRITLPVTGSAHTVLLEEQASLTDIISPGAPVVFQTATPPANRVIVMGDSNVAASPGAAATAPTQSFGNKLRHLLPGGYRTTVWGVPGRAMFGSQGAGAAVAARCDGTAKNIVVIALQTNDVVTGVSQANNLAAQNLLIAGIQALVPAAKIILCSSANSTFVGPDITWAQARANMASAVAGNVSYVDNSAVFPGAAPWPLYLSADLIHYLDAGEALMASALVAPVLAA